MYRDKSKVFISVYMLCYGRTKFISVSSVIFMYRTIFVNKYCNATGINNAVFIFIHLKANSMKNVFEWKNF